MKKKILFLVIFVFLASLSFTQTRAQLDKVFVFDYDLEDISKALSTEMKTLKNKFFVINASVDAIEIIDKNPESFTAKITVLYGEWQNISEISSYKAEIYFRGSEFAEIIPVRPPRKAVSGLVLLNRNISVLCQLTGVNDSGEEKIPVFEAYKIKIK